MQRCVSLTLFAFLAASAIADAAAQSLEEPERSQGILVPGNGEIRAKPNVIEVQLRSAAKAELTGDAIVKYRDAKRRTLEAFASLKVKNVDIEEEGLSITPGNAAELMQMMWRGMSMDSAAKTQIELASTLTVRLNGIDNLSPEEMTETVGKILDVAQDSGALLGPSPEEAAMMNWYGRMHRGGIVKFVLTDIVELREKAYAKAAEDARARATRQAQLFGVELGDVLSVEEIFVSGDDQAQRSTQPWEFVPPQKSSKDVRITADSLSEIPIRVRLMVRYGIERAAAKAGAG